MANTINHVPSRRPCPHLRVVLTQSIDYRNQRNEVVTLEPGTRLLLDEDGLVQLGDEWVRLEPDMFQYLH